MIFKAPRAKRLFFKKNKKQTKRGKSIRPNSDPENRRMTKGMTNSFRYRYDYPILSVL